MIYRKRIPSLSMFFNVVGLPRKTEAFSFLSKKERGLADTPLQQQYLRQGRQRFS